MCEWKKISFAARLGRMSAVFLWFLFISVSFSCAQVGASSKPSPQTSPLPIIESDGRRLSNLIFSGGAFPLGEPKMISTEWTSVSYSAEMPIDDASALVQLNLGGATGEIVIRNFRFIEEGISERIIEEESFTDGAWSKEWKLIVAAKAVAEFRATKDGIAASVSKRTDFPWDVQLVRSNVSLKKGARYRVSFEAKSSSPNWPLTSYLMRAEPLRFYASVDARNSFLETASMALASGTDILSVMIPNLPWGKTSDDAELAFVQAEIERVVKTVPTAKLILRFGVEPSATWRKEHPSEMLSWESGQTGRYVSISSKVWQAEIRDRLSRFVKTIDQRWGDRVIGYAPSAQSTGEWYYPIWESLSDKEAMNFSEPFRLAYQSYLRKKYATVERLNSAWHEGFTSFEEVSIPSGAKRLRAELGLFRNPATQRELFDFTEFQQIAMLEAIENVASVIKSSTEKPTLVLAFYGYLFELPGCQRGIGESGHLALGRLLRSQVIDGVIDITSYNDRGVAGSGALMTPVESILAHGKLLVTEDDSRTHLSSPNAGYERTTNLQETIWSQSRNLLRSLIHNGYTWKFDLYGQGWFNDQKIWDALGRVSSAYASVPPKPYTSDIAVIVDEKSFFALKPGIELTKPLISDFRAQISRTGMADPTWWLLEDWLAGYVPKTKLTIFLNAFYLTASEREAIVKQCSLNGGTVLWLYAPGYLEDTGETYAGMQELTGFRFQRRHLSAAAPRDLKPLDLKENWPDLKAADLPKLAKGVNDYFSIEMAPGVTALASFPESVDHLAIASTSHNGYRSIFCAAPSLTPQFLSAVAMSAGVRRYVPVGNIVLGNGHLLGVTCPNGGSLSISLPEQSCVRSIEGEVLHLSSDLFNADFQPGETKVFQLNPIKYNDSP